MRQPVQVWDPLFYKSPFSEFSIDLERAYKEWQGEDTIWLMPDAKEVISWKDTIDGFIFINTIIPSDILNVFSIYHIDEGGRIYPPYNDKKDANVIKDGLYRKWLKTYLEYYPGNDFIEVKIPVIKNKEFGHYEWKKIKVAPGSIMPITDISVDDYTFETRWPPPDKNMPNTVSPDVESQKFYGKLKFEKLKHKIGDKYKEIDVVSSEKEPGGKALNIWYRWPEPFCSLFPDGGNIDLIYHHAHMRNLIKQIGAGRDERERAIRKVESWVNRFVGDTESSLGKAFVLPKYIKNINGLLIEIQLRYGVDVKNKSEFFKSDEFKKLFFEKVKVKRIYSWLGYFWWEFYCDLISEKTIKFCNNCGNILSGGRRDRIYCTEKENPKCYRQRQALRQKKHYYYNNKNKDI